MIIPGRPQLQKEQSEHEDLNLDSPAMSGLNSGKRKPEDRGGVGGLVGQCELPVNSRLGERLRLKGWSDAPLSFH